MRPNAEGGGEVVDTTLVLAASLTYLLATVVYGVYLLRFDERLSSTGLALMGLGLALTGSAAAVRIAQGQFLFHLYEGFLILTLGLGAAYFGLALRKKVTLAGAIVAPIITMLTYSLHVFHAESGTVLSEEVAVITPIHIAASFVGFAILGVSAGASVLIIIQEYRLKKKRISLSYAGRLPSLSSLEQFAHRTLIAGFPIYSVGMALGAVWFARSAAPTVTRHLIMASFSWLLYALLVHARITTGLRGRRAAVLTLSAFASALFVVFLSALRTGAA